MLFKAHIALKDAVAVEKDKVSDANSRTTSLKKKIAKMAKKTLVDEEISPIVTVLEVRKLTRKLELSEKENDKFIQEIEKLKKKNLNLESKMALLKVTAASNREDANVRKLELNKEMEELAITRAKQRIEEKIVFEREKADIKKRQLEAKASASEASKIAKVYLNLKEANAKY